MTQTDVRHTGILEYRSLATAFEMRAFIGDPRHFKKRHDETASAELGREIVNALSDGRTYVVRIESSEAIEGDEVVQFITKVIILLTDPRDAAVGESVTLDWLCLGSDDTAERGGRPSFGYTELSHTTWTKTRDAWTRLG